VFFAIQLRDIEILVQQQAEDLAKDGKEDATLSEIQKILYSTEVCHSSILLFFIARFPYDFTTPQEGFEVPESGVAGADEEETF
jgi:hypothetical protein